MSNKKSLLDVLKSGIRQDRQQVTLFSLEELCKKLNTNEATLLEQIKLIEYIEQCKQGYRYKSVYNKIYDYNKASLREKFLAFLIENYPGQGLLICMKKNPQDELFLYIKEEEIVELEKQNKIRVLKNSSENKSQQFFHDSDNILIFPRDESLGDDMDVIPKNIFIPEQYQTVSKKQQEQGVAQISMAQLMNKVEKDIETLQENENDVINTKVNTKKKSDQGGMAQTCINKNYLQSVGLWPAWEKFQAEQKKLKK